MVTHLFFNKSQSYSEDYGMGTIGNREHISEETKKAALFKYVININEFFIVSVFCYLGKFSNTFDNHLNPLYLRELIDYPKHYR